MPTFHATYTWYERKLDRSASKGHDVFLLDSVVFLPALPLRNQRSLSEVLGGRGVGQDGIVALALPRLHVHRRRLVVLPGGAVASSRLTTECGTFQSGSEGEAAVSSYGGMMGFRFADELRATEYLQQRGVMELVVTLQTAPVVSSRSWVRQTFKAQLGKPQTLHNAARSIVLGASCGR